MLARVRWLVLTQFGSVSPAKVFFFFRRARKQCESKPVIRRLGVVPALFKEVIMKFISSGPLKKKKKSKGGKISRCGVEIYDSECFIDI